MGGAWGGGDQRPVDQARRAAALSHTILVTRVIGAAGKYVNEPVSKVGKVILFDGSISYGVGTF